MLQTSLHIRVKNKAVIGGDGRLSLEIQFLKVMLQKLEHYIKVKFWVLQEVLLMLFNLFDMFRFHRWW